MENFTLTELSIATVAILGAVSGCVATILHILFQSRCSDINLCCGLIGCKRKVPETISEADFQRGSAPETVIEETEGTSAENP